MKLLASLLLFLLWTTNRVLSQDRCDEGHVTRIRLSADPRDSKNEGVVQMCLSGPFGLQWFYIAPDTWTSTDARVACEELGFNSRAATGMSLTLTSQSIAVTDTVNCNGEENRLINCLPGGVLTVFDRLEVAAVVCSCTTGEIRLVDGANYREGRVEVCVDGRWGTVCGEDWTEEEGRLVCGRLGLPTLNATIQSFGEGTGPIFNCTLLGSCTPSTCTHSNDAGVRCLGFDEACAVTVEEQSTTTTQGTPSTTEYANSTSPPQSADNVITILTVTTALLAAALLAVIIGWIGSCVCWKQSQKETRHSYTGMDRSSNKRRMDNPIYEGGPASELQTKHRSLGPAYAHVNANKGTRYDVINRGGAPRPHPPITPIGSPDQNGDQMYSQLDKSA